MYEFLVLGRLARSPMHGYMIAKVIGEIAGPFRRIQWGALYPVLSRLERDGLIRADPAEGEPDARAKKVYSITAAGRARLYQLLMDTERHAADYDTVFSHKVALFSLLDAPDRIQLCRHYQVFAQRNVDHLAQARQRIQTVPLKPMKPEHRDDILRVLDHRSHYWQNERQWAEALLEEQLVAHKEAG